MDCKQLSIMRDVEITQVDRKSLANIDDVSYNDALPPHEKASVFISKIGNPYCFLCNGIPVRIRFTSEKRTIAQSLGDYFISLK